jgi:hypothetical protein
MGKLSISKNFVIRKISDVTFSIPLVRDISEDISTYTLNETATEILDQVKAGSTFEQLFEQFQSSYPQVDSVELKKDVTDCISTLKDYGILEEI